MTMDGKSETIIVPVDGASNIKLEVLDFNSLVQLRSEVAPTPLAEHDGLKYNDTGGQFAWYDQVISGLPEEHRRARVIAPASRGASGGLVGKDNTLCEVSGRGLTLAYSQAYPDHVEQAFRELAGSAEEFFRRTGSILDFPGGLTLVKRLLYDELERPEALERSAGFAVYGNLLAGHFLGPDHRTAVYKAGHEHSYWMCHTGARELGQPPGTPSYVAGKIAAYKAFVPTGSSVAYKPLGAVPAAQASSLGLGQGVLVVPGGHDTCLSHLPVQAAFRSAFSSGADNAVIHLEAGSWTMVSQLGGEAVLPPDGYRRGIVVQGTLDGEPVVSSMYGGGRDFSYLMGLLEEKGLTGDETDGDSLTAGVLESDCFVLPNINPENHGTGPFPEIAGRITRPEDFFSSAAAGRLYAELCIANTAVSQIEMVCRDKSTPVVLTAGGSKDKQFGRLLATLSGREVYVLYDKLDNPLSETTTLGAALTGKAACLGVHPHELDLGGLGLKFRRREPYAGAVADSLLSYRERYLNTLKQDQN